MPKRTSLPQSKEKQKAVLVANVKSWQKLGRAARSTLFVAGMAAARMATEAQSGDDAVGKLFSPGLVDRLQTPITRFHE